MITTGIVLSLSIRPVVIIHQPCASPVSMLVQAGSWTHEPLRLTYACDAIMPKRLSADEQLARAALCALRKRVCRHSASGARQVVVVVPNDIRRRARPTPRAQQRKGDQKRVIY